MSDNFPPPAVQQPALQYFLEHIDFRDEADFLCKPFVEKTTVLRTES